MPEEKPATTGESSDRNLIAALCYIPIFFIGILAALYVILTEKKQDKFLAFHAWQSLILTGVCIVVMPVIMITIAIVGMVLATVTMGLGGLLVPCVALPLSLAVLIAFLFLAYKAYLGEKYKLPVIGDFAEKQANK